MGRVVLLTLTDQSKHDGFERLLAEVKVGGVGVRAVMINSGMGGADLGFAAFNVIQVTMPYGVILRKRAVGDRRDDYRPGAGG